MHRTKKKNNNFTSSFTIHFTIEGIKEQKMPKTKKQKTILDDKDFQDEWIAMTERVVELEISFWNNGRDAKESCVL